MTSKHIVRNEDSSMHQTSCMTRRRPNWTALKRFAAAGVSWVRVGHSQMPYSGLVIRHESRFSRLSFFVLSGFVRMYGVAEQFGFGHFSIGSMTAS
jgi:hypothetical protein